MNFSLEAMTLANQIQTVNLFYIMLIFLAAIRTVPWPWRVLFPSAAARRMVGFWRIRSRVAPGRIFPKWHSCPGQPLFLPAVLAAVATQLVLEWVDARATDDAAAARWHKSKTKDAAE